MPPLQNSRNWLKLLVAASVILAFPLSLRGAQRDLKETTSAVTYAQVIDLVFGNRSCNRSGSSYQLVMRFLPTEGQETQVIICKYQKGDIEVTMDLVDKNIWQEIQEIYRWTNREDPKEMAARIKKARIVVNVNQPRMREFMSSYSKLQLSPLLDSGTHLDGTHYDLWFSSPSNQVHFSIGGSLDGKGRNDSPLVKWMASIRAYLDKTWSVQRRFEVVETDGSPSPLK